jgi:radical SAM-linked protein
MMRLWERALRRARLPLRYSQGYHPHPRLSLALPLSVGMTAGAEWLDIELRVPLSPDEIMARLPAQLPAGIALQHIVPAPRRAPALATRVRAVEYEVRVRQPPPKEPVQEQVQRLLQAQSWPVQEQHKERVRTIDLRAFIAEVELGDWTAEEGYLRLLLRCDAGRSARLATVLGALGIGPAALFHRKQLLLHAGEAVAKGV